MTDYGLTEQDHMQIGLRAVKLRESRNMTQDQLAYILDISTKHISHIENASANFSLDLLIRFCRYFDVSLDYVIFGEENNKTLQKFPPAIIELINCGAANKKGHLKRMLELFEDMEGLKK